MKYQPTPATFARGAHEFYRAASHLFNYPQDSKLSALFLIGRSIELSLKSMMLAAGISAKDLARKPYRHNISNLLAASFDLEIIDAEFSTEHRIAVDLLSNEYDSFGLGYIEEGRLYLLPLLETVDEAASILLKCANNMLVEQVWK